MFSVPLLIENFFFICLPFIFAAWLIHRFKTSWKVFWIGVFVCIIAWIIYVAVLFWLSSLINLEKLPNSPTTILLIFALITSILSSFFMEGMRWVGFRLAKIGGKTYGGSLTLAAGSGGIEMVAGGLGTFLLWGLMYLLFLNGFSMGVPIINYNLKLNSISSQPLTQSIVSSLLLNLTGILENLSSMSVHFALSIMVWMAVNQRKFLWFGAALIWHALYFGIAVYLTGSGISPWTVEKTNIPNGIIAILTCILILFNLLFVRWSYNKAKTSKLESNFTSDVEPVDQTPAN
jgi:uncharacterized membrane protein YhfC